MIPRNTMISLFIESKYCSVYYSDSAHLSGKDCLSGKKQHCPSETLCMPITSIDVRVWLENTVYRVRNTAYGQTLSFSIIGYSFNFLKYSFSTITFFFGRVTMVFVSYSNTVAIVTHLRSSPPRGFSHHRTRHDIDHRDRLCRRHPGGRDRSWRNRGPGHRFGRAGTGDRLNRAQTIRFNSQIRAGWFCGQTVQGTDNQVQLVLKATVNQISQKDKNMFVKQCLRFP